MKYCIGSAAVLGLPLTVLGKLEQALADDSLVLPKVIWLNGANCTGCTVSLANLFSSSGPKDIADLLLNTIDLVFHPTLMGAAGDLAVDQLRQTAQGKYILVVDGGIPTAFNGHTCLVWSENGQDVTMLEAVKMLAPKADAVLSIGTCASHGGIPAANPNPTGIASVSTVTGLRAINIPGCPPHPDWIVFTIASLLAGTMPVLDEQNRPRALYNKKIHEVCPRKGQGEADTFGIARECLKELGCKGPETLADCPVRKWNSGTNWCIGAGAICVGCTERGFPDKFSPFYKVAYGYREYQKPAEGGSQPGTGTGSLTVSKATWTEKGRLLLVEGKGQPGQIVTISNAMTRYQLGAVSVNQLGLWKFQQTVYQYPSTLTAKSGSLSVNFKVTKI